jgi:hypothetical protein
MSGQPWTQAEDDLLRQFDPRESLAALEHFPGRSLRALRTRRCHLGIADGGSQEWTAPEDDLLRLVYPVGGLTAAQQALPLRSRHAVSARASRLGLLSPCPRNAASPLDCPLCNGATRAIDHGSHDTTDRPRYVRRCLACGHEFVNHQKGRPAAVPTPPLHRCPDCGALVWEREWDSHRCQETMERTIQCLLRRDVAA